jgi:hypothetical protein
MDRDYLSSQTGPDCGAHPLGDADQGSPRRMPEYAFVRQWRLHAGQSARRLLGDEPCERELHQALRGNDEKVLSHDCLFGRPQEQLVGAVGPAGIEGQGAVGTRFSSQTLASFEDCFLSFLELDFGRGRFRPVGWVCPVGLVKPTAKIGDLPRGRPNSD